MDAGGNVIEIAPNDSNAIDFMREKCETWAVVGLSGNPKRSGDVR